MARPPLQVLFLAKSHPVMGGVECWLDDLVTGLMARGVRCSVGLAQGLRFHDPQRYAARHPDLPWQPMPALTGSRAGRRWAVYRLLRRLAPQVVVPVMLQDGLAVACATAGVQRHRVVYPVHEAVAGVVADLSAHGSQLSAAVSVDARTRALVREHAPGLKQLLIPCAVPAAGAVPTPQSGAPLVVGICGRLERETKRVQDVIPVMEQLRRAGLDAELRIAGEGSARDELMDGLRRKGFGAQVRELGALSRAELYRRFYPGLNVLLLCSESETGPLAAFEAMGHGVPVVSADFRGRASNEALRDGDNCLVFPVADAAAAAAAIERVYRDPELAAGLRRRALAEVTAQRSLDSMIQRWQELLTGALPAPLHPGPGGWLVSPREQLKEVARRALGRRFAHASTRAEWPFYGA